MTMKAMMKKYGEGAVSEMMACRYDGYNVIGYDEDGFVDGHEVIGFFGTEWTGMMVLGAMHAIDKGARIEEAADFVGADVDSAMLVMDMLHYFKPEDKDEEMELERLWESAVEQFV